MPLFLGTMQTRVCFSRSFKLTLSADVHRAVLLGLMCLFAGEVALVTLRFEPPSISWCNTCDARPQQYYAGIFGFEMHVFCSLYSRWVLRTGEPYPPAGVALGVALVYAVSLYGFRRSQLKAGTPGTASSCPGQSCRHSGRRGRFWRLRPWGLLRGCLV